MKDEGQPITRCFNITEERGHELVEKYGRLPFERFVRREITDGELVSTFVNIDELTANEKCFLTYHCTQASIAVMSTLKKDMLLAQLLSGSGFP